MAPWVTGMLWEQEGEAALENTNFSYAPSEISLSWDPVENHSVEATLSLPTKDGVEKYQLFGLISEF